MLTYKEISFGISISFLIGWRSSFFLMNPVPDQMIKAGVLSLFFLGRARLRTE
jgi:hypothetical protein